MDIIINDIRSFEINRDLIETTISDNNSILSISSSICNPLTASQYLDLTLSAKNFILSDTLDKNIIDTTIYELIDPTQIVKTSNAMTLISESRFNLITDSITDYRNVNDIAHLEFNSTTASLDQEYAVLNSTINTTNIVLNTVLRGTIDSMFKNNFGIKQDLESLRYVFSSSVQHILNNPSILYSTNETILQSPTDSDTTTWVQRVTNVIQELNPHTIENKVNISTQGVYFNTYNIPINDKFILGKFIPIFLNIHILPLISTLKLYEDKYNAWLKNLYVELIDAYDTSQYIRTYFDTSGNAYSCKYATYIPYDRPFYFNINNIDTNYYIQNSSLIFKQGYKIPAIGPTGQFEGIYVGATVVDTITHNIITSNINENTQFTADSEFVSGSAFAVVANINIGWTADFNKVNLQINLNDLNSSGFQEWSKINTFNIRDKYDNDRIIDTIFISDCIEPLTLILSESKYDITFNTTDQLRVENSTVTYVDLYKNTLNYLINTQSLEFNVNNNESGMFIKFDLSLTDMDLLLDIAVNGPIYSKPSTWSLNKILAFNSYFNDNTPPTLEIYKNDILYKVFNFNNETLYIDTPNRLIKFGTGLYRFVVNQPYRLDSKFNMYIARFHYTLPDKTRHSTDLKIDHSTNSTTLNLDINDTFDSNLSLEILTSFDYRESKVLPNSSQL